MLRVLMGSTALTLALGFAPYAEAQTTATTSSSQKLQTVTVTAERRTANLQKTAIAITTVSGATISRDSLQTLTAVLAEIPALSVAGDPHGANISIRGVGGNGDSNFVDTDVISMYDDVYNGRSEGTGTAMYDVNQVEVLRGPQGTLYGRNAAGGVIDIVTNNPVIGKYNVGLNLVAGNYNLLHADGYINVPVTSVFAVRVAGAVTSRDGYVQACTCGGGGGGDADHSLGVRVKALYQPNTDLSVLGDVDYWHEYGFGNETTSGANPATSGGPPFFNWPVNTSNPWQEDDKYHPADIDNFKFLTLSAHAIYNLNDWAAITFIPSYSDNYRYEDSNLVTGIAPQPPFTPGSNSAFMVQAYRDHQYTGELRASNPVGSKLIWVAGLYYLHDENYSTLVGSATPTAGTWYDGYQSPSPTTSKAVFGQVTYPVTDRFRVTAGLRYTQDQKLTNFGVCTTVVGTDTCLPATSPVYYNTGLKSYPEKYGDLTYKFGVEYDVLPSAMVYAQIASGYKAGGFSYAVSPPHPYLPEKITAYEVGIKSRWLNDTLQVNAEAYYYNYNQLQIQYNTYTTGEFGYGPVPDNILALVKADEPTATIQQQNQGLELNAETGVNKGFEIESKWRFTPNDELDFSPAVIDANYGKVLVPNYAYLTGRPIIEDPKFSGSLAYQHDFDNTFNGMTTLHVDSKYSSGYWLNVAEDKGGTNFFNAWQGSWFVENASATYTPNAGNYVITLWGKNLLNTAVKTFSFPLGRVMLNDPRTFGATVNLKF